MLAKENTVSTIVQSSLREITDAFSDINNGYYDNRNMHYIRRLLLIM